MNTSAIILSVLMLFSMSFAPYAGAEQKMPGPPLSQSLVREGTLAINLANAFRLGSPKSEAEAESALSGVGIAPRNGWIADYPATPDVVIELRDAVSSAAEAGRLPLNKGEALQIFDNVSKDYELPIQAVNTGPAVSPGTQPSPMPPDQTVLNNYYTQEGPPVVTYYAPPVDYSYLYNYVPSPFWWSNAWFPGYYMLRDFSLLALGYGAWYHGYWPGYGYGYGGGYGRYGYWGGYGYGRWWGGHDHHYGRHDGHHGDGHGGGHGDGHGDGHGGGQGGGHGDGQGGHGGDRHVVSNHYRDRDTGATHRIDPVNRSHNGSVDRARARGERWAGNAPKRGDSTNNTNVARNSGKNRQSWNDRTSYNSGDHRGAAANRTNNTYLAKNSGKNRQSWNDRTSYNSSDHRGAAANRTNTTDLARNSGNNRQSWNDRTSYNGRYNRGSNGNASRAYTASTRPYSVSSSYRQQPAQRGSYQTRQSFNSSGRGMANSASYSANRGQFNGGRSFNSGGRGGSFSGSSGRASGGGGSGRRG